MKGDVRLGEKELHLPNFIFEQIYIFGFYPAGRFRLSGIRSNGASTVGAIDKF